MEQNKKIAVVFFSLSGHSERLARKLARNLNADLIPLQARCYTPGILGYLRAGFDSLRQRCHLEAQEFTSLQQYHQLVLCGPVWTSYPATPLRALLQSPIVLPASVSLFLTSGGHSPALKAFTVAESDLKRPLSATAVLANSNEDTPKENEIRTQFLSDMHANPDVQLKSVI